VSAQSPNRAMDIALQNITALAGEESGTPASLCYYMGPSDEPPRSWEYMCDSQTDSDTIYPCPQDQTFGTFVSDDRCTN
jgi:hypothetical protein